MPLEWTWPKQDYKNIKDIHKTYGNSKKIKKLPLYGPHTYALIRAFNFGRVKQFKVLDFVNFNSKDARELLSNEYGWRSYGQSAFRAQRHIRDRGPLCCLPGGAD